MKALLVDCSAETQSLLASILSQAGHDVEFAESLCEPRIANRCSEHEIIFCGVDEPLKNWRESLARFCQDAEKKPGFFVAVTERRDPSHLQELLADAQGNESSGKGFDDVLFWPLEPGQLSGHLATAQSRAFSPEDNFGENVLSELATSTGEREDNTLFDGQLNAFLIADALSLRILAANPPVCRVLGYTTNELLRMSIKSIHPAEDWKTILDRFSSTVHMKTPETEIMRFLRKDGSIFAGQISAYTIQYHGRLCLIGFISERSEAQGTLAKSEEIFKAFISKSAYGFVDLDAKGFVRSANERFTTILGYDAGELRGKHFLQLLDKSAHKEAKENFQNPAGIELKPSRYYLARKKNGDTCHVELSSLPLMKVGKLVGFQSAILDVSERKKAEVALKKSEAMLRSLIENMPNLVLVLDRQGNIKYANHDVPTHTVEQINGISASTFIRSPYLEHCWKRLELAFSTQTVQHVDILSYTDRWWSCQLVPVIEDGRVESVMVIASDVTQQKNDEAKILEEQDLLRRMLELHERDRELVSFEIHDGFSQQLTGALLNLEASDMHSSTDSELAKQSFDRGMNLLRESIAESRRLVAGLRPPVLEEFGIIPAIEQLVAENNDHGGPETEFSSNILKQRLAPPLESAIFRIVQETLANARRHSQSSKVNLNIFQDGEHVNLVIQDWGIGFEPEKIDDDRFGLKGIQERARLLGGQSKIETTPGKGTCISIKLPILPDSRESL